MGRPRARRRLPGFLQSLSMSTAPSSAANCLGCCLVAVLELGGSQSGGHRLGVNGLAVDRDNAILCADLLPTLLSRPSIAADPLGPGCTATREAAMVWYAPGT